MTLPFRARYRRRTGPYSSKLVRLTVTGLYDFDQYEVEECYGLIGVGKEPGGSVEFSLREIEGIEDQANRRLIEDSVVPRTVRRLTTSQVHILHPFRCK